MKPSDHSIIWQPQPGPQTALIACPVFEVLFGGARGGGKTESSIGDWLQHSGTYGEGSTGIFVRKSIKQLSEVIARTHMIFPKIGAKWNEQKTTWTMRGGARLKFVYLERDSDADEYQGHSYSRVYIEEVTNFASPAPINKLKATLRSASGVPTGMRLTGNPGGPGHSWVKKRYIIPAPAGYEIITEAEDFVIDGKTTTVTLSRVFIPSKISDNALLLTNDPAYLMRLKQSGSEALVKAWLEGNWDIIDGAFFDEWDESLHVIDTESFLRIMNRHMTKFRSFDWGSAKPFSVGWNAVLDKDYRVDGRFLPKGAIVRYREWYGAKGVNTGLKMTAADVAEGILHREIGEHIHYGVADPAIFIRNGGPSIAEAMAKVGCNWRAADNKRIPGWSQLRGRLVGENGVPMYYVTDECAEARRLIPIIQHDEKDAEDIDTDAEDHLLDEVRYGVMSRPYLVNHTEEDSKIIRIDRPTVNDLLAGRMANSQNLKILRGYGNE